MISLVVIGNFGSVHFGEVEDDDLKRSSMVSEEKVSGLKAAASASIRSGVRSGAAASASRERNRKGKRRITEEIDEEENFLRKDKLKRARLSWRHRMQHTGPI